MISCQFCNHSTNVAAEFTEHLITHSESFYKNREPLVHVMMKMEKVGVCFKRFYQPDLPMEERKKIRAKDPSAQPILFTDPIVMNELVPKQIRHLKGPLFTRFTESLSELVRLPVEFRPYFLLRREQEKGKHFPSDMFDFFCPDCGRKSALYATLYGTIFLALCHLLKTPNHFERYTPALQRTLLAEWKNFNDVFGMNISLDVSLAVTAFPIPIFDDFMLKGDSRAFVQELLRVCDSSMACAACLVEVGPPHRFASHCEECHNIRKCLKMFPVSKSRLDKGELNPTTAFWFPLIYLVDDEASPATLKEWTCCECELKFVEKNVFVLTLKALLHFYFDIYLAYNQINHLWIELCVFMNILEHKFRSSNRCVRSSTSFDVLLSDLAMFLHESAFSANTMKLPTPTTPFLASERESFAAETLASAIGTPSSSSPAVADAAELDYAATQLFLPSAIRDAGGLDTLIRELRSAFLDAKHDDEVQEARHNNNAVNDECVSPTSITIVERYRLRFCLNCERVFLVDACDSISIKSANAHFDTCGTTASNNVEFSLRKLLLDVQETIRSPKLLDNYYERVIRQPSKLAFPKLIVARKRLPMFKLKAHELEKLIAKRRAQVVEQIREQIAEEEKRRDEAEKRKKYGTQSIGNMTEMVDVVADTSSPAIAGTIMSAKIRSTNGDAAAMKKRGRPRKSATPAPLEARMLPEYRVADGEEKLNGVKLVSKVNETANDVEKPARKRKQGKVAEKKRTDEEIIVAPSDANNNAIVELPKSTDGQSPIAKIRRMQTPKLKPRLEVTTTFKASSKNESTSLVHNIDNVVNNNAEMLERFNDDVNTVNDKMNEVEASNNGDATKSVANKSSVNSGCVDAANDETGLPIKSSRNDADAPVGVEAINPPPDNGSIAKTELHTLNNGANNTRRKRIQLQPKIKLK